MARNGRDRAARAIGARSPGNAPRYERYHGWVYPVNLATALKLLDLTLPKIKPGQTQTQVDTELDEWRVEQLGSRATGEWKRGIATRAAIKRFHPDNQETGDADAFRQIEEAAVKIWKCKVKVKADAAPKCRHCDTPRNGAAFCVECGEPFGDGVIRTRCAGCGDSLENTPHLLVAFCPKCGLPTNRLDLIEDEVDSNRQKRLSDRRVVAISRRIWAQAGYQISPSVAVSRGRVVDYRGGETPSSPQATSYPWGPFGGPGGAARTDEKRAQDFLRQVQQAAKSQKKK